MTFTVPLNPSNSQTMYRVVYTYVLILLDVKYTKPLTRMRDEPSNNDAFPFLHHPWPKSRTSRAVTAYQVICQKKFLSLLSVFSQQLDKEGLDTTIFHSFLCQNHTPYLKFTDCLQQHHFFLATNIKFVSQTRIKDHAVLFYQKTRQLEFKIQHVFPTDQRSYNFFYF